MTELVVVEGEIARLESQIRQLQDGLRLEQEVSRESKPRSWNQDMFNNSKGPLSTAPIPIPMPSPIHRSVNERMAFETKALHFISKAIKGDYHLNDFTINEKYGFLRSPVEQKENNFHENTKFQDRNPKKGGPLKPNSSPFRDPRHPSPKVVLAMTFTCYYASNFVLKSLSINIILMSYKFMHSITFIFFPYYTIWPVKLFIIRFDCMLIFH